MSAAGRVARGVAWMNENLGENWPDFIDRETFNINHARLCVLGQTFQDYWTAAPALGGERWAEDHGFQSDLQQRGGLQREWNAYLDEYELASI